ncbi:MAG: hypothetical protein ACFFCW_22245, partial [Candidatus Hodarchaeota archaeon]
MRVTSSIGFETMRNREISLKAEKELGKVLEDLITDVKRSKIPLKKIDNNIIDGNLQKFFKDVEQDLNEAIPGIVAVSSMLGMLICRILRFWKQEIPLLTSEVDTLEILGIAMDFELPVDLSIWEGIKSATRILQDTITKEQQKRLRNLIATCQLQELLNEDALGSLLQEFLPPSLRKALAANYTSLLSSELLAMLAVERDHITVIDPFCGSGRLLTAVLDQTISKHGITVNVIGNELLGIASILTLTRLLYWFKSHHRAPNLYLTCGDTFERTPSLLSLQQNKRKYFGAYDLVIMNPPFTRYLRLQNTYLKRLFQLYEPYKAYMGEQMGLHVFSLFLADRILKSGGRL